MVCPRCKQTELIFDECEYFCPPPCGAVFTATEIELERCRAEMAFLRKEDGEYGEALLSARSEIERLRTALERDRARVEALKEWCKNA